MFVKFKTAMKNDFKTIIQTAVQDIIRKEMSNEFHNLKGVIHDELVKVKDDILYQSNSQLDHHKSIWSQITLPRSSRETDNPLLNDSTKGDKRFLTPIIN